MPRIALIAGASGLVGNQCRRLLLESPAYERIIILARRGLDVSHPKLDQRIAEVATWPTLALESRIDDVFCALGTTISSAGSKMAFRAVDFGAVLALAKLGRSHGATGFYVVSAHGANARSRFFYWRVKGEMEQALIGVAYPSLGIFRPALISGNRRELRSIGESLAVTAATMLAPLMKGPLLKYRPNSAASIASAMVTAALNPPKGRRLYDSVTIR